MFLKFLVYQIKTIIINLLLGGLGNVKSMDKMMLEIIIEIVLSCIPQPMRIHWRTMNKDDHKEMAELTAHSKVGSLLKTQQPFSVNL